MLGFPQGFVIEVDYFTWNYTLLRNITLIQTRGTTLHGRNHSIVWLLGSRFHGLHIAEAQYCIPLMVCCDRGTQLMCLLESCPRGNRFCQLSHIDSSLGCSSNAVLEGDECHCSPPSAMINEVRVHILQLHNNLLHMSWRAEITIWYLVWMTWVTVSEMCAKLSDRLKYSWHIIKSHKRASTTHSGIKNFSWDSVCFSNMKFPQKPLRSNFKWMIWALQCSVIST